MDRRRLWRQLDRQKAAYRRNIKPVFMRAFDKQIKPLYETIEHISDIRDVEVPLLDDLAIFDAYRKLYMSTALDYAIRARKETRKMTKGEDEIYEDILAEKIMAYLGTEVGATITAVGNTSKALLQKLLRDLVPQILDEGIGGGQAVTMLRDRIESKWHEMKYYRTERIARTEVGRASGFGSWEGMKSVSENQTKVWISAFAADSRDSHIAADNQKVDIQEPFIVNDERLMFPLDVSMEATAGNTINCLCDVYYEVK